MTHNGAVTRIGAATRDGIFLREAGPLDARVIAELHLQCFADGLGSAVWSVPSIVKVLSLFGSYAFLAAAAPETGSRADAAGHTPTEFLPPAGFLVARTQSGKSEILALGVVSARRRQGTARALLQAALSRARQAGAARTLLEVAEDNMAARTLYAAEGFAFVKRWPRYYHRPDGAVAAALIFSRDLP